MSKLVAFFEKKKKKPLKSSVPVALDGKPKKEDDDLPLEVGAAVIEAQDGDADSWVVESEKPLAEHAGEGESENTHAASWLKVSAVSAACVRKREPERTWIPASAAAVGATDLALAADGEDQLAVGDGVDNSENDGSPRAAGVVEGNDTNSSAIAAGAAAAKKWVPPSLRARMAGGAEGSGLRTRGNPVAVDFGNDQDLATTAQMGLYKTSNQCATSRKKNTALLPGHLVETGDGEGDSKKKKKEKKKGNSCGAVVGEGEEETAEDGDVTTKDTAFSGNTEPSDSVVPFDVWKYVVLEEGFLKGCAIAQNNEEVREKYVNRRRWDVAQQQQQVA